MNEQNDDKMIRCPRVGGYVNFKFCCTENNMLPCRWVIGCWHMYMDINEFLNKHFSNEELDKIFVPPNPKIESLVELMEKAKQSKNC